MGRKNWRRKRRRRKITMISTRIFGKTQDRREVLAFDFTDGAYKATVLNYGGIIQRIVVPDKKTANTIYKKWEDKASDLYSVVYETLVD